MDTQLVPYLNFDGTAAEAMSFYRSIFGGKLSMQTFADAFPDTRAELRDRTMHAHLQSETITIMASDTHPEHSQPYVPGNSVYLSLIGTDRATLSDYFTKLADGGSIEMPLEQQFWGDTFGMCTDQFGIHWMVNISAVTS